MRGDLYLDLGWLPQPVDFRAQCRALLSSDEACGPALRQIASQALSEPQLRRLSTLIEDLRSQGRSLAPLRPYKLGLIGVGTLDLLPPLLTATAARHGLALECVTAPYGQVAQEAFDPNSAINTARCDAVFVAVDQRGLPWPRGAFDPNAGDQAVEEAIGHLRAICEALAAHGGAQTVVQTLPPSAERVFGELERTVGGSARHLVDAFNRKLVEGLDPIRDILFDVAHLAETVGLGRWHSPAQWNLAKLPFNAACLPLFAEVLTRRLAAQCGLSRRCLVLDLDNTLWGGVVGDDGLDGVALGQGDATGEAHLAVQQLALDLRARGVVLAVSSKNDDAVARRMFQEHPDMLLRESHIAVFQANWQDKAANIRTIAETLNLGLDTMVFLDDNPAERELVRRFAPQVAVPELAGDPADFARTLAAAGYFEAASFSDEDRKRADFYQDNARRVQLRDSSGSLEDYLASLKMELTLQPFDALGRSRIAQLINKSNQFNLTTHRYSEAEVAAMEADPSIFTLQVRQKDIFGDNGMISVVICRDGGGGDWVIDTWLMSCRVLGRGIERAVLGEIIAQAREAGAHRLIGVYRPSGRNAMVADHYEKLGFAKAMGDGDETRWFLSTRQMIDTPPMEVVRHGVLSLTA